MINAYITLDYELCLGTRTGTAQGCLIQPMKALTQILDKYGIKVNVMADAAYLLRMQQLKDSNAVVAQEYKDVTENIRLLASQGHAIQLHFHPQWIYTTHTGKEWEMDMKHYKLSDLDKDVMLQSLSQAIDLLNSISGQKAKAYRAGGYSVENFNEISELFKEKGIDADTSVLRYASIKTGFHSYNYKYVPPKTSYKFETSTCIECENGYFCEFPVTTKPYNGINYILMKQYIKRQKHKYSAERWNDGISIGYSGGFFNKMLILFKKFFSINVLPASFDGMLSVLLNTLLEYSKKNYIGNDFVIVSHPKFFTPDSLNNLEQFIIKNKNELTFNLF